MRPIAPDFTKGATRELDRRARQIAAQLLAAEGKQIVEDLAGHVGDQIFDVLRRNGMAMSTAAGSAGVQTLAAAQVLAQASDFLCRSLDGEHDAEATAAIALLFMEQLPATLSAAIKEVRL